MKNKFILALFACITLLLSSTAKAFDGGTGASSSPYLISTCLQLQDVATNLSAYYSLTGHIDCTGTSAWNSGQGFAPIGDASTKFTGNFNGNGYYINGLYINRPSVSYVGLFGFIGAGGVVTKVGVTNANTTGYQAIGTLAGINWGTISKAYTASSTVRGTFVGGDGVGGLVGASPASAFGAGPGGVSITDSYALNVNVSGAYAVGGLIGDPWNGTVTNSYAVGVATSSTIYWGPLFGNTQNTGTFSGNVWNSDVQSGAGAYTTGGTGKTTAQMKTQSTFTGLSWDFTNTWTITSGVNGGYPYLQSSVMTLPDTTQPSVSLTMPTDGMVVSGAGAIMATATDNVAVAGVTFYINGVAQGSEDTSSPYSIPWYTSGFSSGIYTLIAVARDTSNNYATSTPIMITVDHISPVLTQTSSTVTDTGAHFAWTTDELGSTLVNYGTTTSYGLSTVLTDNSPNVQNHVADLTGLTPCFQYHYQLFSFDAVGNAGTTTDNTFTTTGCSVRPHISQGSSAPGPIPQSLLPAVSAVSAATTVSAPSLSTTAASARDLKKGMNGADVRSLQQLLIARNSGPAARTLAQNGLTSYFGALTQAALVEYQQVQKITPAIGYFGSTTRFRMKNAGLSGLWW